MDTASLQNLIVISMNKARNNELIRLADKKLKNSNMLKDGSIAKTYDGKTAALSVSVAMSGLLPTLAIYYQDFDEKNPKAPCRRHVLNVVATMMSKPRNFSDAKDLFSYAIDNKNDEMILKKEIIDCAIALKQVVRTYNLV